MCGKNDDMRRLQTEEGKGVDRRVGERVVYGQEMSALTAVTD
jgi:hypothetical protein